jgi:hypothetical protein
MPSQSSNSNGGYTVTSSGTNSQVCIHNTVLRYTLASPTITYPNLKIQSNSHRSLPQISTYPNPNKQQGNSYDSRDYGSSASNQNSYHYSNSNGSYYYSNPNGKKSDPPFRSFALKRRFFSLSLSIASKSRPQADLPSFPLTGSTYYNSGTGYSDYTPSSSSTGGKGGK